MQGRFDEARAHAARARSRLEDVGLRLRAAFACGSVGFVEHLAGDHAAAARELRAGYEISRELGEQAFTATAAANLAYEFAEQGLLEDAERFVRTSADLAAEDDLTTQIQWRAANALVLEGRGDSASAERYASDAVALARDTDDVNLRADTLVVLADVALSDEGRTSALREALELYRAKGNDVAAAAVARRLK
jgi:tetratricopeptide (TPR) repeat protein